MRFFNRVTLLTPESVELEFNLAGIGNRAFALLIDYHVLGVIVVVFLIAWSFLSIQLVELLAQLVGTDNIGLWLVSIAILGTFCIYMGYFVFFETFWQGQTPGKRFAKIRVIRDDGRTVELQQATLRALLRPIDDTLFIGAFLIMLTSQEKRLGDLVAGTLVIQAEQPAAPATFPISETARNLAQQLPQIANLSLLLPDDFAVIREYLQRRGDLAKEAKSELSRTLARQVKDAIEMEKVPEGVTPEQFLEAVYLAYQQQSSAP
ncbi:RDD family protein [Kamptonema formosum]|uniref:RDD family protein n=1 Tax=Kamptonema formosum TaxID=331992 RepID=UPI0003489C40|nr:RDD family protein [Oscillatoria sp. PCC 10802]